MPHNNPPAPPMPRLNAEEAEFWHAKVKAMPPSSLDFNCILPGCPNSYQTKQGLERHFTAIHLPKADEGPKHTRSTVRPTTVQEDAPGRPPRSPAKRRRDSRSRRVRTGRKGRPPGSGMKARLLNLAQQDANGSMSGEHEYQHLQYPDHHTNHSLLASHPASSRHDNGEDENKPREERSFIEFFPFLKTSVRLDIVDIRRGGPPLTAVGNNPKYSKTAVERDEPIRVRPSMKVEELEAESRFPAEGSTPNSIQPPVDDPQGIHTQRESSEPVASATPIIDKNTPTDVAMGTAEDVDGEPVSDPDVFFDAKGFIDGDMDQSQKATGSQDEQTSSLSKVHILDSTDIEDEVTPMEIDKPDTFPTETTTSTRSTEPIDGVAALKSSEVEQSAVARPSIDDTLPSNGSTKHAPSPDKVKQAHSVPSTSLEPKTPMSLLPKSSFRLIPREDDDLEEYHLPTGHNIRYIEPTETELAERVEYDMDEQDEFWLKELNAERRKQDLSDVSSSMFERIFDRLEKEWFDLTKNIPKPTENLPPEDSACNICDDGECENSNAIVFCDGCNLAVHQDCYGIPYIPEGQWLCRKCMLSPQMPVSCIFCPGEGGAFKQTTNNRWAHLLCASWIPEVGVANTVYMEPIDNIDKIPASRWKLTCYICKLRMGACIQCETKNCFRAFHVTCARKAHLYMKSKLSKVSNSGGEVLVYRAHCHKHTPRDHKADLDLAGAAALFANKNLKKKRRPKALIFDDDSDDPDFDQSEGETGTSRRKSKSGSGKESKGAVTSQALGGSRTSKAALAHQKHYTPGAPLAPSYIVNRLVPFVSKLGVKATAQRKASALSFLYTICKYWSLKRESRRGAPLLKRLHLEPWTASASAHRQTEEEKAKKLQTQLLLRGDLEKVRMLAELVRKRERAKLKRQELQNRYLCKIMFPLKTILEDTLLELEKQDRQKFFAYPISAEEVKDYHDVIKNPICFQTMNEKLTAHKYQTVDEFADDTRRIYRNCMTYNNADTPYYRAAARQSKLAEGLLKRAEEEYQRLDIDPRTGFLAVPIDREIFTYNLVPFQKHGEEEQLLDDDSATSTPARSSPALTPRSRRKEVHLDSPKIPQISGSAPRLTRAREAKLGSQSIATSQPQKLKQALDQTPGFRSPPRGQKPMAPKLKTATLTRADMAKARQGTDDTARPKLDEEDELLERLKSKSKKSRSLAVNLQSRLKPSIVDKAVIINKPAPKGWAYVVVEGEEDTTEGEDDEDEVPAPAETADVSSDSDVDVNACPDANSDADVESESEAEDTDASSNESEGEQIEGTTLDGPESAAADEDQEDSDSPSEDSAAESDREMRDASDDGMKYDSDGEVNNDDDSDENEMVSDQEESEEGSSPISEPPSHGNDKLDSDNDSQLGEEDEDGLTNGGEPKEDMAIEGKHADEKPETGDRMERKTFTAEVEPPRKRQKRSVGSPVGDEDLKDESSSSSTRRLRSSETVPTLSAHTGRSRRGSPGSQKDKAAVDIAAKRRRQSTLEGPAKRQKTDRSGTTLPFGSLVWAKMDGFPWFPAELMNPRGSKVPEQVLEMRREAGGLHLVQFFDLNERGDRGRSWYWVMPSQISPLAVDLEEDRKRIHLKTGWTPKRRKSVKLAYVDACQSKGLDSTAVVAE